MLRKSPMQNVLEKARSACGAMLVDYARAYCVFGDW